MALTTAQIQAAYVTFFNRPADVAGLNYWSTYKGSDVDLYNTFAQSAEYTSLFAGKNNTATVNTIYSNLLGRTPDVAGLNYWVGQLDTGALTIGTIANAIKTGAQGTDATTVTNKTTAATTFTAALDTAAEITGYASPSATSLAAVKAWLAAVTTDATLTTQIASAALTTITTTAATGAAATGSTFTLTTGTDAPSSTINNDTYIGDWGATTVQASDQISAGEGTDTFKIYGALGTLPATVTGIEILDLVNPGTMAINLTTIGAPTSVTKLTVEQVAGAGTVTTTGHSGLTLDLATANNGSSVAVTWAANTTDTSETLELSGYAGATGATAAALTITGAAATTLNINTDTAANAITTLTQATATTINIAAATDLNISTSLTATAAKTVNVSGAGKVTIAGSDLAATVTVDGSTNTGGVLYTAEAAGSTLTFKGGSGNDSVTFAAGTLTTADVLTGGTGTDTVAINDTALTTVGGLAHVNAQTGFETLGLNTTGASLDMSLLTNGITNVAIGAGNISATTTNSLSASTYTIDNSASNTGTVSVGNKVGELSTAVTVDYGTATTAQTLAALTLNGATTVSLVSTGTGTGGSNIITDLNNMDNSVINVTGAKNLTITNALDGTGTGSKVDATNFTGILTVTGSGLADIIIGGSKADVINGGAGKDTITGGAGADAITVSTASSNDVITGGADADTFKFSGTSATMFTSSTGTSDIVSITDFVAGTDKISLLDTAGAFTSVTLATQTIATAADLTAVWAGITAIAASADNGAAAASLITVSAGAAAGTYLYVNDTAGAAVLNTADLLVKLTGITGTLATTDFVFA